MKTKNFIQRNGITIVAFAFLAVFGIGWYVTGQSATTNIGEDIVVGGNLSVGGNQVITSAGVLQNVTADAGIITSGTFADARIPNLAATKITSGTLSNARTTGVSTNTANTLVLRDSSARFRANSPSNNADVATKLYVDNAVAGAGGDPVYQCVLTETVYRGDLGGVSGAQDKCVAHFGSGWTFAMWGKFRGAAPGVADSWVWVNNGTCSNHTHTGNTDADRVLGESGTWEAPRGGYLGCNNNAPIACCNF